MAQYFEYILDEKTLNKLHKVQLEMMDEFVRVCDKYNLEYFLDHGTALGAIRHDGFIPWDDDIDVAMFRKDYDKFLKVAQKEFGNKYFVQTYETEPLYFNFHLKIRKENTIFPQHYTINYIHRGIQLDVFPLDKIPGNKYIAEKWICLLQLIRKIYEFKANGFKIHKSFWKKIIYIFLSVIPTFLLREFFIKLCLLFNKKETQFVTCLSYGSIRKNHKHFFDINDISPSRYHKFENRNYKIMNNPDAYLKTLYGNYNKIPPKEKRGSHVYGEIVFDTTKVK